MPHLISNIRSGLNIRNSGRCFVVANHDGNSTFSIDTVTNTITSRGTIITGGLIHTGNSSIEFFDNIVIKNVADSTKKLSFDLSGISSGNTRNIIMPDNDVDLGTLVLSLLTTQGDILYHNGVTAIRFPLGAVDNFLKSDGTDVIYSHSIKRVDQGLTEATIITQYAISANDGNIIKLSSSSANDIAILPDATTLPNGWGVKLTNNASSTERLNVKDNSGVVIHVIEKNIDAHAQAKFYLVDNSTVAGEWLIEPTICENEIYVAKSGGDFTSIKTALDSIITNSSVNRFMVRVCPGSYTESPMTVPSYVTVHGADDELVIVNAASATDTIFTMSLNSTIRNLLIKGASGVSGIGVLVENIEKSDILNCTFNTCEKCIMVRALTAGTDTTNHTIKGCVFNSPFDYAVHVDGTSATSGGLISSATLKDITVSSDATTVEVFRIEGPTATCSLFDVQCIGPSVPSGIGLLVSDAATVTLVQGLLNNYTLGFSVDGIGAGPDIKIHDLNTSNNTNDVSILNTGTTGILNGTFDKDKVTIDDLVNIAINFIDPVKKGLAVSKQFLLGPRNSDLTDISDLIQQAPMGLINGGEVTINTALSIDISTGFGYIMKTPHTPDPPGHTLRKWTWGNTVGFAVDPNTTNYIYWDENEVLSKSASEPNILKNLLLAIVYTDANSILWIDKRNVDAHHYSNKQDNYVRKVFGPLYSGAGSVCTNPSSNYIAVTAGTYFHNQTQFSPSGVNSSVLEHNDTLQAGSTDGIIILKASASAVDNYYSRYFIKITGAGPTNEIRRIIKYDGTSKQATVAPVFSVAPGAVTYEIIDGFTTVNKNGAGFDYDFGVRLVDVLNYSDGSGGLTALAGGEHAKHALYTIGDGDFEKYFLVFGQEAFASLLLANSGALPSAPPIFSNESMVKVASIIVDGVGGTSSIVQINDIRPLPVSSIAAITGVVDHGGLIGLGDDDHPQYVLADGSRAMTSSLDMGGFNITNVGTVDNVDISGHAARHLPGGADPLTTAVAEDLTAHNTNNNSTEGNAESYARSDHTHKIPTAAAVTLDYSSTNTDGNSATTTFARSDHTHKIDIDDIETEINHGNIAGLEGNDHPQYLLITGATKMTGNLQMGTSDVTFDVANTGIFDGVNVTGHAARHLPGAVDGLTTAAPGTNLTATTLNTDGLQPTFSRSDHIHAIDTATAVDLTAHITDNISAEGSGPGLARANHTHKIPTAGPTTTLSSLTSNDAGLDNTTTFSKSDHTHEIDVVNIAGAMDHGDLQGRSNDGHPQYLLADGSRIMAGDLQMGTSAITFNTLGNGVFDTVNVTTHAARHLPNGDDPITTSTVPTSLSAISLNVVGNALSLARSDHTHAIPSAAPITDLTATTENTLGGASTFARSDHTHKINVPNIAGYISHGFLNDLESPADDHKQYLLIDGTRAMTGDLKMGGFEITGVGNVDGVDISGHAARHLPNSTDDPLSTAAPLTNLSADTLNTLGGANSFARSDHIHAIDTATAVDLSAHNTNNISAEGSGPGLARANHTHKIPTEAPTTTLSSITINDAGGNLTTTFSKSDHTHAINVDNIAGAISHHLLDNLDSPANDHPQYLQKAGDTMSGNLNMGASAIVNVGNVDGVDISTHAARHQPGGADGLLTASAVTLNASSANTDGNPGTATLARSNHTHNIDVGTPVGLNTSSVNFEGGGVELARASHTHAIPTSIASSLTANIVNNINTIGSSANFSRADHTHKIPTAAPGTTLSATTTSTEGTADNFARADHIHAIETAAAASLSAITSNTDGNPATTGLARADHTHAISTAIAVTLDSSSANTIGISTSFARADHTHNINVSEIAGTISHHLLDNLVSPADDHKQYLLVDGTRAMSGDLDMGDNKIDNISSLKLDGSVTGTVTINPASNFTSYTLTLPINNGNLNQVLTTNGVGELSWANTGGSVIDDIYEEWRSDDFLSITSDGAVNVLAPSISDPLYNSINVRAFDSSTPEAVGFLLKLPASKSQIVFRFTYRCATGDTNDAVFQFHYRRVTNTSVPAAVSAWFTHTLNTINTIADEFYRTDSQTLLFSTPTTAIVAGEQYICQISRNTADGNDGMASDLLLSSMVLEIS